MTPPPRRILVRGVNWLGDAVMTTPALQRLREHLPQAHITLLIHEKLSGLWLHHPGIDTVVSFASDEGPWSIARRLRGEKFDTALVLPNSPRSALEMWLARIPGRIGYARPWRNWLLTRAVAPGPGHARMQKLSTAAINRLIKPRAADTNHVLVASKSDEGGSRITHLSSIALATEDHAAAHHLHEYLHLAAALGASPDPIPPNLFVTPEETEAAAKKFGLETKETAGRPIFALNPGAEYGPAKRWPLDRFAAAAREIQKQTNCVWLILGAKSDLPTAEKIHSALMASPARTTPNSELRTPNSQVNLPCLTTLRELMALLKLSRVLLTNDTGPMHVAAALGTPVVVPFGSTSPELTGPGLPGDARHRLLTAGAPCSPCFRSDCPIDFRCMTNITVERVVEAVQAAARRDDRFKEPSLPWP